METICDHLSLAVVAPLRTGDPIIVISRLKTAHHFTPLKLLDTAELASSAEGDTS